MSITWSPIVGSASNYRSTWTVASDKSGTDTLAFTEMAVATTRIIALSGDLNFGSVVQGQSATKTLTINNAGNRMLTWTSISTTS